MSEKDCCKAKQELTFVDICICTLTDLGLLLPYKPFSSGTILAESRRGGLTSISRRRVFLGRQIHDSGPPSTLRY